MKNIYLTGFMGSGKSTVGPMIAQSLKVEFTDIDDSIVLLTGKVITDIFRQDGEQFFRSVEKQVLQEVTILENRIVSLGGGTLMDRSNLDSVKGSGVLVYFYASPNMVWKRICNTTKRPLLMDIYGNVLSDKKAQERIEELLIIRKEGYSKADIVIDTDKLQPEEVLKSSLDEISKII